MDRPEVRVHQEVLTALRATTYREGSSRWVATSTGHTVLIVNNDVAPVIWGVSRTVWHKKKPWRAQQAEINVRAQLPAWDRLTREVPQGLFAEKDECRIAVAILARRKADLIVLGGRQRAGFAIEGMPALLRQRDGRWCLARWLKWNSLSDEEVREYLMWDNLHAPEGLLSFLCATAGRPQYAEARRHAALPFRSTYLNLEGDRRATGQELAKLAPEQELRAAYDVASANLVEYAGSVFGRTAGCSGSCWNCTTMPAGQCTARHAVDAASQALVRHTELRQYLGKLEKKIAEHEATCAALGFAPHEYGREP